jgi:hypothetical protein
MARPTSNGLCRIRTVGRRSFILLASLVAECPDPARPSILDGKSFPSFARLKRVFNKKDKTIDTY